MKKYQVSKLEEFDIDMKLREVEGLGLSHNDGQSWGPISIYKLSGRELVEAIQDFAKKKGIDLPEGEITLHGSIDSHSNNLDYQQAELIIKLPYEKVVPNPYKTR